MFVLVDPENLSSQQALSCANLRLKLLIYKLSAGPCKVIQWEKRPEPHSFDPSSVRVFQRGEMAERLKAHAWKACVGETLPRVRIPLSPPIRINNLQASSLGFWVMHPAFALSPYFPLRFSLRILPTYGRKPDSHLSRDFRRVHTSTVKKSAATIRSQCRLKNSFQVVLRFLSGVQTDPLLGPYGPPRGSGATGSR